MYFYAPSTKYNWGFLGTPQTTVCLGMVNRQCPYSRGKGVGGTSLLNGLMYVRGNRRDYDRWAEMGNPEWSYEKVLPYFKKSEGFSPIQPTPVVLPDLEYSQNVTLENPAYHGHNGPFHVEYHRPYSPQFYTFLEANRENGWKIGDYNAKHQLWMESPTQLNNIHGRRVDLGKAFIKPVLNRTNLKVQIDSYVTKILIRKLTKTAYGVNFMYKGKKYITRARKEIILSAGAISSPPLLLLSGIGPEKELKALNIPVYQNLPVGRHLIDHATFYGLNFYMNYTEPIKSVREYVEEFLNASGPYAIAGNNQGIGFLQTKYQNVSGLPDIEYLIVPSNGTGPLTQKGFHLTNETYYGLWGRLNSTKFFKIYVILLHPRSKGTVKLKSSNPFEYPLINSNFLSDPENIDINAVYEGAKYILSLLQTQAFKSQNVTLQPPELPACAKHKMLSKAYWFCCIRQVTMNVYHPMGSNRMGPNPDTAVVDSKLRVHGIKKLRVADASIFPSPISGHPNAAAVMVGEVVSDMIKGVIQ